MYKLKNYSDILEPIQFSFPKLYFYSSDIGIEWDGALGIQTRKLTMKFANKNQLNEAG